MSELWSFQTWRHCPWRSVVGMVRQPGLPPYTAVALYHSINIHQSLLSRGEAAHWVQETAPTLSLICWVKGRILGSVSEWPVSFHKWKISVLRELFGKRAKRTKPGSCQLCWRAALELCLRWDLPAVPWRTAACLPAPRQSRVSASHLSGKNAFRTPAKLPGKSSPLI